MTIKEVQYYFLWGDLDYEGWALAHNLISVLEKHPTKGGYILHVVGEQADIDAFSIETSFGPEQN